MNPFGKIKDLKRLINKNVVRFPVLLLEGVMKATGTAFVWHSALINKFI